MRDAACPLSTSGGGGGGPHPGRLPQLHLRLAPAPLHRPRAVQPSWGRRETLQTPQPQGLQRAPPLLPPLPTPPRQLRRSAWPASTAVSCRGARGRAARGRRTGVRRDGLVEMARSGELSAAVSPVAARARGAARAAAAVRSVAALSGGWLPAAASNETARCVTSASCAVPPAAGVPA